MKVLFISSWYPTSENPNFGIFVKEHAKAISTLTDLYVLAVVVQRGKHILKASYSEYIDESGTRTFEIIIHSRFRNIIYHLIPLQSRIAYKYYKRKIEPLFTPDIIHSNVIFPAGMIGDYFSRKLRKPHIITEHWSKIEGLLKKPYLSSLARRSYKNAEIILPVSKFLKDNILTLLPELEFDKFKIIPNVISSEIFTYKEKTPLNDKIKFCAIATWATKKVPDKKPELFIEALNQFQKASSKKVHLTMIGGGDRLDDLKQLCAKQSFEIEFTGYLAKTQIAQLLQESDYFIHASTIETFGVVIVEALMTGTPVICSKVAALPELIDVTNGILCENTVADWLAGINIILQKDFNRKEISERVRNIYSSESVGFNISSIYKELIYR
jgi:L-malate glycosyltransferase